MRNVAPTIKTMYMYWYMYFLVAKILELLDTVHVKSQFYESSDSEITYMYLTGIPVINNKIIGRKFHRKLINDQHFKTNACYVQLASAKTSYLLTNIT